MIKKGREESFGLLFGFMSTARTKKFHVHDVLDRVEKGFTTNLSVFGVERQKWERINVVSLM